MRLAVVTQYVDGVGELSAKGRIVKFARNVCSGEEPKQGSWVKHQAERQRRGPAIATAVEVLGRS